jgi:hypothetical protein
MQPNLVNLKHLAIQLAAQLPSDVSEARLVSLLEFAGDHSPGITPTARPVPRRFRFSLSRRTRMQPRAR